MSIALDKSLALHRLVSRVSSASESLNHYFVPRGPEAAGLKRVDRISRDRHIFKGIK